MSSTHSPSIRQHTDLASQAELAELEVLLRDYGEPGSPPRCAAIIAYTTARAFDMSHLEALRNARFFADNVLHG